jgi:hypothetical protein
MSAQLRKRAIARAAEILGGEEVLAVYLNTDIEQIRRWMQASEPAPERVLQSLSRVLRGEVIRKANHSKRK